MNTKNEIYNIQKDLLNILPHWNFMITKPFKQLLDNGVSLEMYYCLNVLHSIGVIAIMTDLGNIMQTPKQHMTKIANRLVEQKLVERIYDKSDRRIIKLKLTEEGIKYIEQFLNEDAKCFKNLLENLNDDDRVAFGSAIKTIASIFKKIPYEDK